MGYFGTPYDWPRPEITNEDSELWPINAWRDVGVTMEVIDSGNMQVVFSNSIALPIIALYDTEGFRVDEWDDAATFDFGNVTFGYGAANVVKHRSKVN